MTSADIIYKQIAETTINGFRFFALTGARAVTAGDNVLILKPLRKLHQPKIEYIKITYNHAHDSYDVDIDGTIYEDLYVKQMIKTIIGKMNVRNW